MATLTMAGDGRGDTRLPVLLDLPDVHPQVHSQGQVPLHAALAAAARLLRIPQQGGRLTNPNSSPSPTPTPNP
eukprot:scaffold78465_cov36-Phaeocystis_antarctica.AAC.2